MSFKKYLQEKTITKQQISDVVNEIDGITVTSKPKGQNKRFTFDVDLDIETLQSSGLDRLGIRDLVNEKMGINIESFNINMTDGFTFWVTVGMPLKSNDSYYDELKAGPMGRRLDRPPGYGK